MDTCPGAGVVDGIDKREKVSSLISIAQGCKSDHRPGGGMGILATIFADAGRIALDIPWIERCMVEGRSEEQSQPSLASDELIFQSGHRARRAGGIGRPADHALRLKMWRTSS